MGRRSHGCCSTEPNLACGALRNETLICGLVLRKLLSLSDARLKLKPLKFRVRKMELRISELMASPKLSEKASRNVREESSLTSATNRQLWGKRDWAVKRCS